MSARPIAQELGARCAALVSLLDLARDESAVPQLVDEGAARPLVHLCQRSNDGQVLVCAALALSRMAAVMGKRFEVAAGGRGMSPEQSWAIRKLASGAVGVLHLSI